MGTRVEMTRSSELRGAWLEFSRRLTVTGRVVRPVDFGNSGPLAFEETPAWTVVSVEVKNLRRGDQHKLPIYGTGRTAIFEALHSLTVLGHAWYCKSFDKQISTAENSFFGQETRNAPAGALFANANSFSILAALVCELLDGFLKSSGTVNPVNSFSMAAK